jgi:polyisoprenoid-binding protein YceI
MTVCYQLDPGQSRFTVQAFAGGLLSAMAHNPVIAIRDFTGKMCFTPATPEDASLQMTVKAGSLEVAGNVNPKDSREIEDTMRKEVLEVAAYPEIHFRSTAIVADKVTDNWYRLRIEGRLSLHGVTNGQHVEGQLRLLDDEIRLSGEFTLLLSAYKIKRVSALGGMITLKDALKFSFDLVGRKEGSQ